jgi:hypothetical protein
MKILRIISAAVLVLGIILFVGLSKLKFHGFKNKNTETETAKTKPETVNTRTGTTEVLELIAETDLNDAHPSWVTPRIDYKFKIRTEGHAINIQFTGSSSVPYPTEGNFQMPSGAQQGSAVITRGPNEKGTVHVQLYKKRYI